MRLIEGSFPDYRQVIPKAGEKVASLGRERLLQTLRRISLLSSEKSNAVKLELEKGNLRIAAQNPDLGEARRTCRSSTPGEPLKIGFNAKYLIDVLTVLQDADVRLELADDLSPGVVRPAGEADEQLHRRRHAHADLRREPPPGRRTRPRAAPLPLAARLPEPARGRASSPRRARPSSSARTGRGRRTSSRRSSSSAR